MKETVNRASNWLEDSVGIGYSPDVYEKLIHLQPKPTMVDRTITVDTNYLVQVNQRDLISMLFDVKYENSVKSNFKKQMARLFRNVISRKIDLYLSDIVMSEFVGYAPKNKELAEIYKKYIGVIYPARSFQPCFFHLAAAINACIVETGQAGDIKDTYSYTLAALAGIRYYVTRDKDVVRVYKYLSHLRKRDFSEQIRQINKIKNIYRSLCHADEETFPIDDVLGFILIGLSQLPVPVSIEHLGDSLPAVLDKVETILWMFRTLKEINQLKSLSPELPPEWNGKIVAQAKSRIEKIAVSVALRNLEETDAPSFHIKLVEKGNKWKTELTDPDLASALSEQLNVFWAHVHEEEETMYRDLEEQFHVEEIEKDFLVQCNNCGKEIEVVTYYDGVVGGTPREMGAELYHKWSNEFPCPTCGETIGVSFWCYEYPAFCINYEDIECFNCEIVRKVKAPSKSTTTLANFLPKPRSSESSKKQY